MSPASVAPRPSAPGPSATTTPRPVLWIADDRATLRTSRRRLQALVAVGHPVTLAAPDEPWVTAPKGVQVHHPVARSGDARWLLRGLHRPAEPLTGWEEALHGDPVLARLVPTALTVRPTRGQGLEEVHALLAAVLAAPRSGLLQRQVIALAEEAPEAVPAVARVRAAAGLAGAGRWPRDDATLQELLRETATSWHHTGHDGPADPAWCHLVAATFSRGLHADRTSSPLVEDPAAWLAPLRSTPTWQRLTAPGTREPAARPTVEHPHVVLLPGTYGRFEQPVVRALEAAGCTVDLLDLAETHPTLARRLPRPENLAAVEALVERGEHGLPAELVERLAAADVVWAEWADLPAVWASHLVRPDQRLVLRLHSLDTLDPWLHLVRWAAVDAVVAVGAPVARTAWAALGEREDLPPVHVVGHWLADRWSALPLEREPAADRRLVMVKWGRRVKDPLWALELLRELRREDPRWTLRLIGEDIEGAGEQQDYERAVLELLEDPALAGAVERVGHTDDVAAHLGDCGFVLSTSRRESFHLGVVEGAASGCVPVVRDWPVFARYGGAREVLPADWVVTTQEEAAARIRSLADPAARLEAASRARQQVREAFPPVASATRIAAVALGRESAGEEG